MMKLAGGYEVITDGIRDTSEAPRGRDILYRCVECTDLVPSSATKNVGCRCGNIFIDYDCFRLSVRDYAQFQAVREKR